MIKDFTEMPVWQKAVIYGHRVKYFAENESLEIQNLIGEVIYDLNKITNRLNNNHF